MKERGKNRILFLFGIILFSIGLIALIRALLYVSFSEVLWFSYIALLLIGIGILIRNAELVASQVNIIFIPYIIWNIDFFYQLITGISLWGITDYFFTGRALIAQIITLQHVFIIPVAFFALYLIKLKRKDFFLISIIQIVLFYIVIRFLGDSESNVNCVFSNCLPFSIPALPYIFLWFTAYFVMIGATSYALVRIRAFNKK